MFLSLLRDNNYIKDFPQLADGLMVIPLPVEEQCRGVLSEPLPNLQLLTGTSALWGSSRVVVRHLHQRLQGKLREFSELDGKKLLAASPWNAETLQKLRSGVRRGDGGSGFWRAAPATFRPFYPGSSKREKVETR